MAREIVEQKSPEEIRSEMSASGLLSEAGLLMKQQNYTAAVPYLKDYLERMKESDDKRVLALMQDVRFKLGKTGILIGDSEQAQTYFEQYMNSKPIYRRREVLKSLAVSYFESKNYEKSIAAVTNAFAPPPEVEEEEEVEEVKIDDLDKEDRGGLTKRQLKRYQEEAEEYKDEFFTEISADKPQEEPEYTVPDKVLLNLTLAESYAGLKKWKLCVDPYEYVIENADKMPRRGYAIMKLVTALSNLGEYDQVRKQIVDLANTDVRYDIRVNMAMMNAASALFNVAEYDSALMLYRMILPRRALADFHLEKANELRRNSGMREMQIALSTNDNGKVESLLGYKYAEASFEGEGAPQALGIEMPPGLAELEESIGTLLSLPPYEDDVVYRVGQLYYECGRPWEALGAFDLTTSRDPDGERGSRAFCDAIQVLSKLELYDRMEKRCFAFLDEHKDGTMPRQVAYYLTAAYQKQEKFKKIKELRPYLEGFTSADSLPAADKLMAEQYGCELYYMQAIADLMLLNYKDALQGFDLVLDKFPKSHQEDNVRYWHAMTQMFLQNYSLAYDEFEYYLGHFPKGNWVSSAWFQGGICLFGQEKYEEANERFTYVIDTYPASAVYPDACSMRGDIRASQDYEGNLKDAVSDYREAIRTAKKVAQATYATFQMAAVYELDSKNDEIIELVNNYLDTYGEEADVAKAAYWLGKIKLEQGLVGEAIDAYLDTILKYGDDVRQDGVDLIISELMNTARRLEQDDQDQLRKRLESALASSENPTLQLRLRVMLAEMDDKKIELGDTLINELETLNGAPPPVLAVICDASFANEDYSRAEEILKIFMDQFEESEYMRAAYKLRAYDLFEKGSYDEALKIVSDAQGLYGVDVDTAWAQVMKGRIELEQGNTDTARESFKMILTIRAWRGEPYAEACYYLGETEEKAGNLKKAFAWYQRTYFMYKGHAGGYWAAEGYLASARCLQKLGRDVDMRNTYRAMLYDKYVNELPQADVARQALGPAEVREINEKMAAGIQTNLTVTVESEEL
ncbi:tetratricopeptide repeat protein [Tichowtungia aerotolerans]|uniref:Tetratricopeptide repeat protein n=1 Tax=Tichowtungia aerotolerans TaxID=2697043 RepID=A0A6P1M921_9BACT|nr:tetratricopeptide repeat protein [Tichowtungia aerotolerans]QHI70522.1 tetratricopeptide repeat protein [Tichowtungia aerotolerans]